MQKHSVDKYNFKVLSFNAEEQETDSLEAVKKEPLPEPKPIVQSPVDASAMSTSSKDSLIESLLKKTDEMSSNFIKLQMKLENMTEEHKEELKKVREESFAQGVQDGIGQAAKDSENSVSQIIDMYNASIKKLEQSASEFEKALEGIKKELLGAALDISKEVIKTELKESSSDIAKTLASELIKELQSASKISLRVNPKDFESVSRSLGTLSHVEVTPDSAVSTGGVVAISDAGNIDAQISKRFERVKRAALSE